MGLGDDLIFLGKAEEIYKQTGKKITPVYGNGWSPLFDNIEFLTKTGGIKVNSRDTHLKSDYHIDYYEESKEKNQYGTRIKYRPFKPTPFKLRHSQFEIEFAQKILDKYNITSPFCIINPDYKSSFFSNNKNWGFHKYQQLVYKLSPYISIVRLHPGELYKEPPLKYAINIESQDLRIATVIMSKAKFGVTYDGLLQHVCAGFNIPCVVIQGGLINETIMSYSMHLYHSYDHELTPCGAMYNCDHCKEANESITVDQVFQSCMRIINENTYHSS